MKRIIALALVLCASTAFADRVLYKDAKQIAIQDFVSEPTTETCGSTTTTKGTLVTIPVSTGDASAAVFGVWYSVTDSAGIDSFFRRFLNSNTAYRHTVGARAEAMHADITQIVLKPYSSTSKTYYWCYGKQK